MHRSNKAQPQRIVMIEHSLKGSNQVILVHTCRNLQQHRLVEVIDRPATLQQPMHDWCERQCTGGDVGQGGCPLLDKGGNRSKRLNCLMLEHRARGDYQPRLARPAHQLDRYDAVAPELKEIVRNPNPANPQHFPKQRAQDLLLRRARPPPRRKPSHLRRRQRAPVELAIGRERKPLQYHIGRWHHVVRNAPRNVRPQRSRFRRSSPGRHHIAHQPLVPSRVLTRNHRSLRHPRMAQQHRLDLARLNAKAAQLHLRIRAPEKLQHPVRTPARNIPAAVHPASRRPKRVRNKPLRRQPRTIQIAPRKPRSRNVQLPRYPRRYRLQTAVQHIHPRVPDRPANRHITESPLLQGQRVTSMAASVGPYRFSICVAGKSCNACACSSAESASPLQMRRRIPRALLHAFMRKKNLQHGRNKMQRRHTPLADDFNELTWIAVRPRRSKDQAGTSNQRPEEFPDRNVKTKWRLLQDNIIFRQGISTLNRAEAVIQTGMSVCCSFRGAESIPT